MSYWIQEAAVKIQDMWFGNGALPPQSGPDGVEVNAEIITMLHAPFRAKVEALVEAADLMLDTLALAHHKGILPLDEYRAKQWSDALRAVKEAL